jgi:voltage-gated potassium channel Kch
LISGYVCLGLLGFFICTSIELLAPGSFNGLVSREVNPTENTEGLIYFSYITLLTIGYGDIAPVTRVAKSASMLIGLLGQFYMVIITAIVVGKFISQANEDK